MIVCRRCEQRRHYNTIFLIKLVYNYLLRRISLRKFNLHLVCNAHLDPVWQWQWPEAAAEAISTFRIAAQFCKQFDGFVFNHNEALLYMWVERFEPQLFSEIQKLVKAGKWNIIGGWYLQPDCNLPCGEAIIRQILVGKNYFRKKFGVDVTVAANFDSFGHTRGLVQILVKSGYDSYLFGRPDQTACPLPAEDFVWVGYDGSEITAHRSMDLYTTQMGDAAAKIEKWLSLHKDNARKTGMVLWGIGNHGGGPSKIDLQQIAKLITKHSDVDILHSTPQSYFKQLSEFKDSLPRVSKELRHCMAGCYSSMARVKQNYRLLENEIFAAEKMLSAAHYQKLMRYPADEIADAVRDMMFVAFHDILPGSSVEPAEKAALDTLGHGLEITTRLKTEAMFALAAGLPKAKDDTIPIMIYNPHPFAVNQQIVCEVSPPQNNFSGGYMEAFIYSGGKLLPSQTEQPFCSINIDGRKRISFNAKLAPGTISRFDCKLKKIDARPKPLLKVVKGKITFKSEQLEVVINCNTGLVDRYVVNGKICLSKNAFSHLVCMDTPDSWGTRTPQFRKEAGRFKLMDKLTGSAFSAVEGGQIESVRVIEDGVIRSVVEAVFEYQGSAICQRYILPKQGTEIEIETRVYWNEKDRILKLCVPFGGDDYKLIGQTAYGNVSLYDMENEQVAQKWLALVSSKKDMAITCINDSTYGCDMMRDELRITMLRSPAYCGAKCMSSETITPLDRFTPRMDQGLHAFRFWFDAAGVKQSLETIERMALVRNEKPFILPCFPPSDGKKKAAKPFWSLDDKAIVATCAKKAEKSGELIIRLFEPTGKRRTATLSLPFAGKKIKLEFTPFEIKTLCLTKKGDIKSTNLMEKIITKRNQL